LTGQSSGPPAKDAPARTPLSQPHSPEAKAQITEDTEQREVIGRTHHRPHSEVRMRRLIVAVTKRRATSCRWMLSKSWGLRTACTIQLSGVTIIRVRRGDSGSSMKRATGPGDTVLLAKKFTSDSKTKR